MSWQDEHRYDGLLGLYSTLCRILDSLGELWWWYTGPLDLGGVCMPEHMLHRGGRGLDRVAGIVINLAEITVHHYPLIK